MPLPLLSDVAATIGRRALFTAGDVVAAAVSGGADSVALAWVLRELSSTAPWRFAGLIHVNHGLRGAESDGDEAFCRALAVRMNVPIEVRRVDVRARARAARRSLESTARELRYAAFEDAAAALGATVVATGHTLDDQAETVLLRALAGAGTRGLSGVRPARGCYRRPLIDARRAAVEAWLTARGESWRTDASNADRSIPRNRIRHELVPVVERLAPGGVAALARLADLAADDEAALEATVAEMLPRIARSAAGGVQLNEAALGALPAAIGRRVLRAAMEQVVPGVRLVADHLETVRRLATSEGAGRHADLPGLAVARSGGWLDISRAGARPAGRAVGFDVELPVPGSVVVPEAGVTIVATLADTLPGDALSGAGRVTAIQAGTVRLPLVVRSRRPGDAFRPLGAPGRRKVQDLLVDRKVPRQDRDRVPIVADAANRIVWVAGVAVAEWCRVRTPGTGVVILELRNC